MYHLFPVVVYQDNIGREFESKELEFITDCANKKIRNMGNSRTENTDILEHPTMSNIKDYALQNIEYYAREIKKITGDVEFYITQSWINYTEKGEYHHVHKHPNSLLSGVIYIDVEEGIDNITFLSDRDKDILSFEYGEYNTHNSEIWWISIKPGDIVVFPSNLFHQVEMAKGNKTRISLSFNTFVKGHIGNNERLTGLNL